MRGNASMHCKYSIESDIVFALQWHFLDCKFHLQRNVQGELRLATSPTLPYVHLYSFTFYLSCIFRHSSYDRWLCHARYYNRTSAFPPLFLLTLSFSLDVHAFTYTSKCVYVHISERVTGYPVLARNTYESQGCRESARRSGITHLCVLSAFLTPCQECRCCIIHERAVRKLIDAHTPRVRTHEGYFATVLP